MCLLPSHHPCCDTVHVERLVKTILELFSTIAWSSTEGHTSVMEALKDIHPLFFTAMHTRARLEKLWGDRGTPIKSAVTDIPEKNVRSTLIINGRRHCSARTRARTGSQSLASERVQGEHKTYTPNVLLTSFDVLLQEETASNNAIVKSKQLAVDTFPSYKSFAASLVGLMASVKEAETLLATMNLVNACVISHQGLEDRLEIRQHLLGRDIVKIMSNLRFTSLSDNSRSGEHLRDQLGMHFDLFMTVYKSDIAALRIQDVELSSIDSVNSSVRGYAETHGCTMQFLALLQILLTIDSGTMKGRQKWDAAVFALKAVIDQFANFLELFFSSISKTSEDETVVVVVEGGFGTKHTRCSPW